MPLIAALLLAAVLGQEPGGALRDTLDLQNPRPDPSYMLSAPIVVVASVTANIAVGEPQRARNYPQYYVQRREVTCSLENVLKGDVKGPVLRFYYFALDFLHLQTPVHAPLQQPEPGKRYLLFLREDEGVLRSVGDVFDYSVRVLSGAHPDSERLFRAPLGEAIAEILLTPGTGYRRCFLDGQQVQLSQFYLTSKAHTVHLIEPLLSHPDAMVRPCACMALAYYLYPGHDRCVFSILDDPEVDAATKQHFRERFASLLHKK